MTALSTIQHTRRHVFMMAYNFYGHHKPFCALASLIVLKRPVYVTYLVPMQLYDKIVDEFSRHFEPRNEELSELIRVIAYDAGGTFDFAHADKGANEIYKLCASGHPIPKAPGSKETFPAINPPSLALVDSIARGVREYIHTTSNKSVKVLAWNSPAAVGAHVIGKPIDLGGWYGDLDAELKKHEEQGITGQELRKVAEEIWLKADGKVHTIPGGPSLHDYEFFPQISPFGKSNALPFRHIYNQLANVDGLILMSSPCVEGPLIESFKQYFGSRPVFSLAPLAPPVTEMEMQVARKESDVFRRTEIFLDDALDKYGENSVVYFSFGSVFWCAASEKIWTFLDVLLALKIPVLFAHASPIAVIPDEVMRKLNESENVYHSKWLPQQMVLHHKATGWFVTHAGHNSVTESLMEGVPMICWPIDGDQPVNAAWLTHLNLAYELFEVRTGDLGLRPVHRLGRAPLGTLDALRQEVRDIFAKARGEDGLKKRRNALKIKEKLSESWKEGGHCWNELERLFELGGL